MRLTLKQSDMEIGLAPKDGGCVTHLTWRGTQLLRPAPHTPHASAFNPLDYAAFPLVPFSGRIQNGQIQVDGERVHLAPNMPPEPHAIHGHGWRTAWDVEHRSDDAAQLGFTYDTGDWPWPYQARQIFQLMPNGLSLKLELTNLGTTPMPAGLGWHPYFPRADAQIALPSLAMWPSGDNRLQSPPIDLTADTDLRSPRPVNGLKLDNCFDVEPGPFRLIWPQHSLEITPDPIFSKAIVYVPPGEAFFCAEPVSHAPNAINAKLDTNVTGLTWLAPKQLLSGEITLRVRSS